MPPFQQLNHSSHFNKVKRKLCQYSDILTRTTSDIFSLSIIIPLYETVVRKNTP